MALIVMLLSLAASAGAAPQMKATMRAWKADALSAERMLADGKFDEAEWRRILAIYAKQASDFAAGLGSATPERRDMSTRFARFSADAQDIASAGPERKARFSGLRGQCRSCHDAYAN
jgi:hypothetical protein